MVFAKTCCANSSLKMCMRQNGEGTVNWLKATIGGQYSVIEGGLS